MALRTSFTVQKFIVGELERGGRGYTRMYNKQLYCRTEMEGKNE